MNQSEEFKKVIGGYQNWFYLAKDISRLCRLLVNTRYLTGEKYPKNHGIQMSIFISTAQDFNLKPDKALKLLHSFNNLQNYDRVEVSKTHNQLFYRRRDFHKSYLAVPRIDLILQSMFTGEVEHNKINKFIIEDIIDYYELGDKEYLEEQFYQFANRFNKINIGEMGHKDLFLHIQSDKSDVREQRYCRAFVELLELQGIIYPAWNIANVKIVGRVDSEYLIKYLFSFNTKIPGLDYILQGGLILPDKGGLSIVITGPTGSGKTSLALNLSTAASIDCGASIYFTFEQSTYSLKKLVTYYGLNPNQSFVVTTDSLKILDSQNSNKVTSKDSGLMMIRDLTKYSDMEIRETVKKYVTSNLFQKYKNRLVVLDSINSVSSLKSNTQQWRTFLHELSEIVKSSNSSLINVVENIGNPAQSLEPFVADMAISLNKKFCKDYKIRSIDILKSRQSIHRGEHQFSIIKGKGIEVYPSPAAVLAKSRRRSIILKPEDYPTVEISISNFKRYFGINWWRIGSSTAFIGESGTLKSHFARTFIEDAKRDGIHSSTLSLYFGTEFCAEIESKKKRFKRDSSFGTIVELFNKKSSSRYTSQREILALFRIGYVSSGQVLFETSKILDSCRERGYPIGRVVINDIDNISYQYPLLHSNGEFLPALVDLLLGHNTSIVMVCSTKKQSLETDLQKQVESLAENILNFQHIYFGGTDYIGMSVKRSVDSSHKKGIYHLDLLNEKLVIKNSFDLLHNVRSGHPEKASVNITLYAETDIQKEYVSSLNQIYTDSNICILNREPEKAFLSPDKVSVFKQPSTPQLNITQFDNYRLLNMIADNKLINLDLYSEDAFDEFVPESLNDVKGFGKNNEIYAIPYFLNTSFLCFRRDCFSDYDPDKHSWYDILQQTIQFSREQNEYIAFDCPHISMENYNCFFLEICLSLLSKEKHETCLFELLESDIAIEAASIFKDFINNSSYASHTSPEEKSINVSTKAVSWRLWYCTYRQLLRDLRQSNINEEDLYVAPLPNYCSIKGDWYFGILNGSCGIESGMSLLTELCSVQNSVELLARGVGLPPYKCFYDVDDNEDIFRTSKISTISPTYFYKIYRRSMSRSDWGCYPFICSLLFRALNSIIDLPKNKEISIRIKSILKETTKLLVTTASVLCITSCKKRAHTKGYGACPFSYKTKK